MYPSENPFIVAIGGAQNLCSGSALIKQTNKIQIAVWKGLSKKMLNSKLINHEKEFSLSAKQVLNTNFCANSILLEVNQMIKFVWAN